MRYTYVIKRTLNAWIEPPLHLTYGFYHILYMHFEKHVLNTWFEKHAFYLSLEKPYTYILQPMH